MWFVIEQLFDDRSSCCNNDGLDDRGDEQGWKHGWLLIQG